MKILLMILVSITLLMPVYSQDEVSESEQHKKKITSTRDKFEFGYGMGIGLDNDCIGLADIFRRNIIIDLDKAGDILGDDGLNVNFGADGGLFVNVLDITINKGKWDFGFFSGTDGSIHGNIPQSLFKLFSEGNINQHSSKGMISVSGGVFTNMGLRASAKYGKLRVGVRSALYTPILYLPKSGITYYLDTEEEISLTTSGNINVYYPVDENGQFTGLPIGLDMALEGEYELFHFLDVGGSFSGIPVAPAKMKNRVRFTMPEFTIKGESIFDGKDISEQIPDFEFEKNYDITDYNVFRPLRLNAYAKFSPFKNNFLGVSVIPNLGFSVDINEKQGYFNAGLEGQLHLMKMLLIYLGTGYKESLWKQRLGLALTLRAFELDVEAALQSHQGFAGSFRGQGFSFKLGMSFGW